MPTDRRLRPVWAAARPDDPAGAAVQPTLDEVGVPLSDVTFVVVDLETTGGRPSDSAITEIGAVKVRGGEVLGEFQTLVDPGGPVPPFIQVLTGITTAMLVGAPKIEEVLPSFLEWARGAVLVAHNAPFDVGFLRANAAAMGYRWPAFRVADTVKLARRAVTRDEVPNYKLSSLAAFFRAATTPSHRALDDARATVDVLHGVLGRLGPLGVTHLEDLETASDPVPQDVRRKRTLADGLPDSPGVYLFRGPRDEVLYVGTSTTSLRHRVRSYFTSAEKRPRMVEMVRLATRVDPVPCATPLEARVRELRLIAEHSPRYNRRSRFPERMPWVRLTCEPYPRLSVVREVRDDPGAAWIGPFTSGGAAQLAVEALHEAFPIRQCTRHLPLRPAAGASSCVLGELGKCGAPCVGGVERDAYHEVVAAVRAAMTDDPAPVVERLAARIRTLVATERFEDAAAVRDRMAAFLRGATRTQRTAPLARISELAAARRTDDGGWDLVLVRHGRLAATARVGRRDDPMPVLASLRATAEHVAAPVPPASAAHPEETDLVLGWLEQPGVRIVDVDGEWSCPVRSAQRVDPIAAVALDLALPRPGAERETLAPVVPLRPARTA